MSRTESAPDFLQADGLPATGFIRLPRLIPIIGVARSTLLAWVQQGRFPRPHKIGPRAVAWRVEEVRAFLGACQATVEPDANAVKAVAAAKAKRKAEAEKAARRALLI